MDNTGKIRYAAILAGLMAFASVFGELISEYIWALRIAVFMLQAFLIIFAGAYGMKRLGLGTFFAGVFGGLLGLLCACLTTTTQWIIFYLSPFGMDSQPLGIAGSIIIDSFFSGIFWVFVGFILGMIGALFVSRRTEK